ncbi:COQ9 family protein [Xinfangfangia sp. CPCC 101601]|uniref:COQ9 family protein n=1 Tax=Pseudogemmobacter lacusdianii TaxID=3069608 RepID=A0ABU0VXH6_9RHOB|nr:COQ9 family protein [Xinfangfangia sp. CPCC 101601]MDQ2066323.1 COQ9 family protein [Xinfangfangia sp. CPCC 101601]
MAEEATREAILGAAMAHVPFDGWSEMTLKAAAADSGQPLALARALFPRGGLDLALTYHRAGDRAMIRALADQDLGALRFRERVALAVRLRLEAADSEAVRRGSALFALPQNSAAGAKAIWGTADAIWTALGDTSDDINWYSKRATLSAVYGATVLFWLGDESSDHHATWDFLDRRIEGVMQFEKAKAAFAKNPLGKALLNGPLKVLERIHAPKIADDLPGRCQD